MLGCRAFAALERYCLRYHFEDCLLDTDQCELRRGGRPVSVAPQVFDLLAYLIANRERVVTKDELIEAIWQGRIVSDAALTTRLNVARGAIGDSGEEQRLIKTLPRKGFRFIGGVRVELAAPPSDSDAPSEGPAKPTLALPDKPSIAVLPFSNLSGDPEQEYFADGVVEDIIAGLSHLRWLFVIARDSSFVYKGRNVDIKQVGRELGVRYVLQGSVRKSANQLRITSQLADTATGASLYANRFEGTLGDVFELQDRVTESVVSAIAPKLEQAEIVRAQRKTEHLDAYDHYLRGLASYYQWSQEGTDEAVASWHRATALDPDFAPAYAMCAMASFRRKTFGWFVDPEREITEAVRLSRRAIRSGRDDAMVLGYASLALAFVGRELDEAAASAERAVGLNPNLASTRYASGWIKVWLGEPDAAIEHFAQAMRLSPLDPLLEIMRAGTAHAHFFACRYDEACAWADATIANQPDSVAAARIAAAIHAEVGRMDKAKEFALRLRRLLPALTVSGLKGALGPYRRPEDLAKYEDALRKAGLPE